MNLVQSFSFYRRIGILRQCRNQVVQTLENIFLIIMFSLAVSQKLGSLYIFKVGVR